jgi:heptosyltransferase-3
VPDVEIDALVYRETFPMLAFNPDLARVLTIDRGWKKAGVFAQVRAEGRLVALMRSRHYDLVVHLTDHRRGAWIVRAIGPAHAVAPRLRDDRGLLGRFWNRTFSHRYPNASSVPPGAALARRHTVEQNLDALRRLGLSIPQPPKLTMTPGEEGERAADALLARLGVDGPFVAMQPTSRWSFKCWPVASNAALVASLLRRGRTVVLSCAPDARERAMLAAIATAVGSMPGVPIDRLKVADDDGTLNRLAALIARASLYVGIDSAPMHLAAAMGTPVVALFGPSGEFNWGPWQVPHRIVASTAYPCRPCGQDGCGGGKVSQCLVDLPVSQALAAIDDLQREVAARDAAVREPLLFA